MASIIESLPYQFQILSAIPSEVDALTQSHTSSYTRIIPQWKTSLCTFVLDETSSLVFNFLSSEWSGVSNLSHCTALCRALECLSQLASKDIGETSDPTVDYPYSGRSWITLRDLSLQIVGGSQISLFHCICNIVPCCLQRLHHSNDYLNYVQLIMLATQVTSELLAIPTPVSADMQRYAPNVQSESFSVAVDILYLFQVLIQSWTALLGDVERWGGQIQQYSQLQEEELSKYVSMPHNSDSEAPVNTAPRLHAFQELIRSLLAERPLSALPEERWLQLANCLGDLTMVFLDKHIVGCVDCFV